MALPRLLALALGFACCTLASYLALLLLGGDLAADPAGPTPMPRRLGRPRAPAPPHVRIADRKLGNDTGPAVMTDQVRRVDPEAPALRQQMVAITNHPETVVYRAFVGDTPVQDSSASVVPLFASSAGPRKHLLTDSVWRAYPSYSLWVRTFAGEQNRLQRLLFHSMRIFWPKEYGDFILVLDDERQEEHRFGNAMAALYPFPKVIYEQLPEDPATFPGGICGRGKGYDRQQWSRFFADTHTDAEVIGFLDNDSLFVSVVTPQSLFDAQKRPIIIGKHTPYQKERWALATRTALCKPQVADFMFTFPIHVKRTTFANVRKHIMGCLNVSRFDLAFRVFAATNDPQTGSYGEFNIILNYAWYHERDEYDWHIQAVQISSGAFADGTWNRPVHRTSTHARGLNPRNISYYLRQGYCLSCLALGNCLVAEAASYITSPGKLKHYVLFNWEHTGHEWVERKLGDAGHPVHLQQVHYGHVAALGYRWPPDIAELINLNATHFPDCSKPKDRTGCREYNLRIHMKGLERKQFWQWEHGQTRTNELCGALTGQRPLTDTVKARLRRPPIN